jgi:hypothetical protein
MVDNAWARADTVIRAILVRLASLVESPYRSIVMPVGSDQPVGGVHATDGKHFTEQELHPGMNPDPAERGRQLGHENAHGGHSVGTGGHGATAPNMSK